MKTCILMTIFNEEIFVESAINSALGQLPASELEIVVLDDGSTDNTTEIVEEIAKTNNNVTFLKRENMGVAKARNVLLNSIPKDCELVTFLDGDDAFAPGALAASVNRMRTTPDLDLCYGYVCLVESDDQDLPSAKTSDSAIVRGVHFATGLFRKPLIERIGAFDESFEQAEDTDYLFRMFESAPKMYLDENIVSFYRQHSQNITKNLPVQRRSFMRAMLGHAKRRKQDPTLASVDGIFSVQNLSKALSAGREQ